MVRAKKIIEIDVFISFIFLIVQNAQLSILRHYHRLPFLDPY